MSYMTKLRITGLVFFGLAAFCATAEAVLYGDVGADGVLQESMFLPLTFLFAAIAFVTLAVSLFRRR